MPVAALPGNVRLRAFQLGKETTFGTSVAATRRFPWAFAPTVDPHWTFPTAETGTLDEAINPYRLATDVTGTATGPLAFNDVPYLAAALIKAGVTPTGGPAYAWTFAGASTSQDNFEIFTGEWGDEVTGDQFQYGDGILERLQLQYPEDLGPVAVTADWRFANVTYPHTRTSLSVDFAPHWVYAADTALYIDSTAGSIGITQLSDTMHGATIDITNNIDVKRFANGSNTRFQVAGYGRGLRTNQTTFTFAKSAAALAEVADWLNAAPQERFVSLKTTSVDLITGTTYYGMEIRFAGYWFTRTEGVYQTANTTAQLVCHGFLDQTLAYPFQISCTNTLSAL